MERWLGKVAVVTGASSGIGAAIAVDLVNAGMIVVGLARRVERVEELKSRVPDALKEALHSFKCDVAIESEVTAAFEWVTHKFGGVDVLINNAGIVTNTKLIEKDNTADIQGVINTNVMGVVFCTREAYQSMKSRQVDGHIVIINSIVGHFVPYTVGMVGSLSIYPSSKHAVTAMTEVLRQELQAEGCKTKITVKLDCLCT